MSKEYNKLFEEEGIKNQLSILKEKINEIIKTINFIGTYYKTDDYVNEVKVIK